MDLYLRSCLRIFVMHFLGENGTKPVIISSDLSKEMEVELLEVLKRNVNAFTWSIEDIKAISPSICMHKILMEEDDTPTVEHQRRLNPAVKEVVKKEVLKWLNAEFIYAISYNPWVNRIHVVPKKGGITVVKNEKMSLFLLTLLQGGECALTTESSTKPQGRIIFPCPLSTKF